MEIMTDSMPNPLFDIKHEISGDRITLICKNPDRIKDVNPHRDDVRAMADSGEMAHEDLAQFQFRLRPDGSIYIIGAEVADDYHGMQLGAQFMSNLYQLSKQIHAPRMELFAGMDAGGYTWAKFGFLPSNDGWRDHVRLKLQSTDMPDAIRQKVMALVDSPRPADTDLWEIADIAHVSEGYTRSIGQQLLSHAEWSGDLDLSNRMQTDRLSSYIAKKLGPKYSVSGDPIAQTDRVGTDAQRDAPPL